MKIRLHDEQYHALPEEDRYQGDECVEELLKRMASGERLSKQELEYLKIYANLQDIEMSEASNMDSEKYRQISAYRENSSFLQKATSKKQPMDIIMVLYYNSGNDFRRR